METLSRIQRKENEAPLFIEEVLSSLSPGAVVLDAGCGAGSFSHAAFPALRVVSLDVKTPRPVPRGPDGAAADPRGRDDSPRHFILGDVESLPLAASQFDFVVMNYVLEHLTDPKKSVSEAARVMKPGGLLYAALPNSRSFDDRFYRFAGCFAKYFLLKFRKRLEHQQRFDFLSLNRILYEAGFRLVSFAECPSGYTWMNDPRIRRWHVAFLRALTFVKTNLGIDLFSGSNYLTLYEYAGPAGLRRVTHVCAVCGMPLVWEKEGLVRRSRGAGRWVCPYCGAENVHG
ncbi:MAG: methyltransferase domain-containing protein [Candidatus Eisenbacteria bacterium]|nr:methyltransferase domain-containing protein [Candidatus Eisenbacteria bacterium]